MCGYISTFGWVCCRCNTSCFCYYLCTNISNLCSQFNLTGLSSRYTFVGKDTKLNNYCFYGSENCIGSTLNSASDTFIKDVPSGIGAQSGNSVSNGVNGNSELVVTETTITNPLSTGAGTAFCICCGYANGGYDFSFGGYACTNACYIYNPGNVSALGVPGSSQPGTQYCYVCMGFMWTYIFGSSQSGPHCFAMPFGAVLGGSGGVCLNRTYNMGFSNDLSIANMTTEYEIPLSLLVSDTNTNTTDIVYGRGAGITTSASFGGGGNRLYPQGGSGLVVLVY
jgi:hypothetical protein